MGTKRLSVFAVVVAGSMLAGACARQDAGAGGPDGPDGAPPSYSAAEVVLRVEHVGGNAPAERLATALPALTVYGDGRVITVGPQIAIYPPPALPNLQLQRISAADVARLVELAVDAGVDPATDPGLPGGILDASSTRFTVLTGAGPQAVSAYALNEAADQAELTNELTDEQRAARAKLEGLAADLADLPGTLGPAALSEAEPYRATTVAAVVQPSEPYEEAPGLDEPPEVAWPGPALPGELQRFPGEDLHCVTATGDQAAAILAAAATANELTPWTSEGQRWRVTPRPLLPDESSCADLADS